LVRRDNRKSFPIIAVTVARAQECA